MKENKVREILTSIEDIGDGWFVVRYRLDPPQPWLQGNLNDMLGPQTQVIRFEKREHIYSYLEHSTWEW